MEQPNQILQRAFSHISGQVKIIWALTLRELATRYGRDNIGFLWIVGEPLMFCAGVTVMWSLIRPHYEQGVYIYPFIITGYLPLTLMRHTIGQSLVCARINSNLLYHRKVKILHFFICRALVEFVGTSAAFFIIVVFLHIIGLMDFPKKISLVYAGWFILAGNVFGLALIFGSLAHYSDIMERAMNLLTYVMIPVSGAFYMIAWLPYQFRASVLKIPLVNCLELIRAGFLGEFYPTYYNVAYASAWAVGFTFIGLILLTFVRNRLEID